jgi:hypothetical protein
LHPQQRKAFIEILAGIGNLEKRNFQKKDSEKLARLRNAFYICTPQNTGKFLDILREKWRKRGEKKASKFFQVFLAGNKKKF